MARIRDWLDLGRNTIESLKISDATRFYETEWPETKKMLIADHREAIEGERKRLRRFVRTRSAILYGLAKRLAPLRRLLFVVAFVWFFICLFGLATREIGIRGWPLVEMAACFMLMTVLLAQTTRNLPMLMPVPSSVGATIILRRPLSAGLDAGTVDMIHCTLRTRSRRRRSQRTTRCFSSTTTTWRAAWAAAT